jgi:hypothetical protein
MTDNNKDIRELLQKWLDCPDDWKETVLGLQSLMDSSGNYFYFTENAKSGIDFLAMSVFGTVCKKCDDWRAWNWMNAYARAYLDSGEELPLFDMRCWEERCGE